MPVINLVRHESVALGLVLRCQLADRYLVACRERMAGVSLALFLQKLEGYN
jgi:hypothetical protein